MALLKKKCGRCKQPMDQIFDAFGTTCCKRCFAVLLNDAIKADEDNATQAELDALKEANENGSNW